MTSRSRRLVINRPPETLFPMRETLGEMRGTTLRTSIDHIDDSPKNQVSQYQTCSSVRQITNRAEFMFFSWQLSAFKISCLFLITKFNSGHDSVLVLILLNLVDVRFSYSLEIRCSDLWSVIRFN